MKQNIYKIVTSLFVLLFCALVFPASLMAQSESYLDTIYRAVNGNGAYSTDYETEPEPEVEIMAEPTNVASAASNTLVINTDDPNATVVIGSSTPLIKDGKIDVNVVLSDMTRILIGMNTGLQINTSSFTIIDLSSGNSNSDNNSNPSTNPGTDTPTDNSGSNSGNNNPSDNSGSNSGNNNPSDNSGSNSGNNNPSDNSGSNSGNNTPSDNPGLNPGTNPSDNSGSNSGTNPSDNSGSNSENGSNPDPFNEDNNVTTPNSDSAEDIDNLKSKINSNYGIPLEDGTSKFTVKQLELMDATFAMMKAKNSTSVNNFMKATTKILRDKTVPENSTSETVSESNRENVAGYVTMGKTEVHILDRAANLSEKNIKELEEINKRKFSQAELERIVEENYVHTIVHEMTHAFQNSEKAKGNDIVAKWTERFWESDTKIKSDGIAPSSYAKTAPYEDMAECVSYYVTGGGVKYTNENGKEVFRAYDYTGATMDIERYNWIKENIFNGVEFLDTANSTVGF